MRLRVFSALAAVVAVVSVISLTPPALSAGGAVPYTQPHTPDGHPDFRGYWTKPIDIARVITRSAQKA